ncbi:MAG: ABC transporter ATP-binding protein [Pikeienuella sp.]|uniref:ABC transporter ATP-binding protein n=1 Tax=Pikeienuella sp. TaxID=2831957 RepID=UPI00391ABCA8
MTPGNGFISIRNVAKSYGAFRAIENISMDIGKGEFFSLLGASGCGKTTLLRMLAGFEDVSGGEIWIDGQEMSAVPPFRRPVNMVFQNYAIFPHMNVADNVGYGLRKLKLPQARRREMVDEMLDLMRLAGYGGRKANELSGGQRQRVALARALILKPKVLLLDEPLGALDRQLREQMQVELRRLQRSIGITFVFVTHDQEEALTLSDRIAVMDGGDVLQVGSPADLYERPASRAVASFIGNMNFLRARVTDRANGCAHLDVEALGRLALPAGATSLATGSPAWVAIRPERFMLSETPPADGSPAVEASLELTTYLGERCRHIVRLAGHEARIAVSEPNARSYRPDPPDRAKPLWLTWSEDAVIVLEGDRT